MTILWHWIASLFILAVSIALAVDLGLAYAYRKPISWRQAAVAIVLVILITWRIIERMMEGSL